MAWLLALSIKIISLIFANLAYADLTAEEGQAIFDTLFYPMLGWFGICFMIGLAIKMINRS